MKYDKNDENELQSIVCETNEDARSILYELYEPTIKYLVKKYTSYAKKCGVETNDLYQEALVGFVDGINSYDDNKNASLKTFITICIERRLKKIILKAKRLQKNLTNFSLSLDYNYQDNGSLLDVIEDKDSDPFIKYCEKEQLNQIEEQIKLILSANEYQVYLYLKKGLKYQEIAKVLDKNPKQIDNTIQRIKNKIKLLIKGEKLWKKR